MTNTCFKRLYNKLYDKHLNYLTLRSPDKEIQSAIDDFMF